MTDPSNSPSRKLGDSFAVAILQWPAAVGAMMLDGPGWELAARIVLGTWVVLVSLGMIVGRKAGPRWGLVMTLCAGLATGLWLSVPTAWAVVWFVALVIVFHAAVHARMHETVAAASDAQEDAEGAV
ncbi:MAG: hypothetical protein AAFP87_06890 [Pseudomonadota bacterium]